MNSSSSRSFTRSFSLLKEVKMRPEVVGTLQKCGRFPINCSRSTDELDARSVAAFNIVYKWDKGIHTTMKLGNWVCSSYPYLEQLNPFQPQRHQRLYTATTCRTTGDAAHMNTVAFNRENLNLGHSQNTWLIHWHSLKTRLRKSTDYLYLKQVKYTANSSNLARP